jgi:hypothetical protein
VNPGTYTVVETPPSGDYTTASFLTTINPASLVNSNTGQAIQVQVLDPSAQTITVTWPSGSAGLPYTPLNVTSTFDGSTATFPVGQFNLTLSGNQGNNTNPYVSMCADLNDTVYPGATFTARPSLTPVSPGLTTNYGRIGYIFNHFGNAVQNGPQPSSNPAVNGAGLQLALWELEYDTTPDLTSGNFSIASSTPQNIKDAANYYLTQSAGKSEDIYYLNYLQPQNGKGG